MFQKLANSERFGLQIEKILDDFTWNDPEVKVLISGRKNRESEKIPHSTELAIFPQITIII